MEHDVNAGSTADSGALEELLAALEAAEPVAAPDPAAAFAKALERELDKE